MLSTIWSFIQLSFEFDSTDGQILQFLSSAHAYDIIINVIIQLTSYYCSQIQNQNRPGLFCRR